MIEIIAQKEKKEELLVSLNFEINLPPTPHIGPDLLFVIWLGAYMRGNAVLIPDRKYSS